MKTARQVALETLFGKDIPDQRWTPKTTLQRLGQRYPDLMGSVADHAAARLTEFGEDVTEAQLLLIQKEAESLGLQAAVANQIIDEGFVSEGKPHPMFPIYLRLNEQVLKMLTALGIDSVKTAPKGEADVNPLDAWNRAMSANSTAETGGQGGDEGEPVDGENRGGLDIRTAQDSEAERGGEE